MQQRFLGLLLAAFLAAGCTGGGEPVGEQAGELKRRDVASLPAVGDYLPPLDDGRLSVAPPVDWKELPRSRTYLLGLSKGKPNELPRIVINAEAASPDCPEELTEENADALAERLATEVEEDVKAGRKRVPEYHLPIVLGETVFVRHVRHASLGGNLCAVQSLQTVRGGRMFTVELIVPVDAKRADDYGEELKRYRDYGYAVAANLKFKADDQQQNPIPPASESAAQPAEPKSDTK